MEATTKTPAKVNLSLFVGPKNDEAFHELFTVFAADTGAFFVGRALGRHKLAPAISPGKSWEGFAGGVVAAVLVSFLVLYVDREEFLSIPESLVLGAAIALASVLGDLATSTTSTAASVRRSRPR